MTRGPQESDLEWMLAALRLGAGSQTKFAAPDHCDWSGFTAMRVAVQLGRADVVRFLWEKYGPDRDALVAAVYYNKREIAELLVALGAEICHEYWNTLETAVRRGHDELFHWLLEKGAPITGRAGQDTLCAACGLLREDIVRLLIDRGAEAEPPGTSLVGGVCKLNHEKPEIGRIVRFLLDYGADPNGLLGNGDTPLITACRFQPIGPATVEIADTLLNAGADPNRRNLLGETALTVAVQGGLPSTSRVARSPRCGRERTHSTGPHTPVPRPRSRARRRDKLSAPQRCHGVDHMADYWVVDLRAMSDTIEICGGIVLVITFAGTYPEGSAGNPTADRMKRAVAEAVSDLPGPPAAVLFDMTELHYEWGDAILGILYPLMQNAGSHRSPVLLWPPVAIAARGATRHALTSLGVEGGLGGLVEVRLVETREVALDHLRERLAGADTV